MKKFVIVVLILIASSLSLNILKSASAKNYSPQSLAISNTSTNGTSISYTTAKPTKGFIGYSKTPLFKLIYTLFPIPIPLTKLVQDDHKKILTTHHTTIKNLESSQTYNYYIVSGNFVYFPPNSKLTFKTDITQQKPNVPKPIYGEVKIDEKSNLPSSYSLVYIFINQKVFSTYTNSQGRWSLDLSQEKSLPESFDIFINGGVLGNKSVKVQSNKMEPAQTIFLNET